MSIRSGGDSKQSLRHCQHTASFFGEYWVCLKQDTIVQTNARDLRWETKEYQATNLVVALGMRWWGSYQNGKAGKAETFNFTWFVVFWGLGGFVFVGFFLCFVDCYNRGAQVCAALWVKLCLGTD